MERTYLTLFLMYSNRREPRELSKSAKESTQEELVYYSQTASSWQRFDDGIM